MWSFIICKKIWTPSWQWLVDRAGGMATGRKRSVWRPMSLHTPHQLRWNFRQNKMKHLNKRVHVNATLTVTSRQRRHALPYLCLKHWPGIKAEWPPHHVIPSMSYPSGWSSHVRGSRSEVGSRVKEGGSRVRGVWSWGSPGQGGPGLGGGGVPHIDNNNMYMTP